LSQSVTKMPSHTIAQPFLNMIKHLLLTLTAFSLATQTKVIVSKLSYSKDCNNFDHLVISDVGSIGTLGLNGTSCSDLKDSCISNPAGFSVQSKCVEDPLSKIPTLVGAGKWLQSVNYNGTKCSGGPVNYFYTPLNRCIIDGGKYIKATFENGKILSYSCNKECTKCIKTEDTVSVGACDEKKNIVFNYLSEGKIINSGQSSDALRLYFHGAFRFITEAIILTSFFM
jgi:hypothetical protein